MRNTRDLAIWLAVGLAGALLLTFFYPRVFPLLPEGWEISRAEAEMIALERLRDLGDPVENPYIVVRLRSDSQLERRMQLLVGREGGPDLETLRASEPADSFLAWDVRVFEPGAVPSEWTYLAVISRSGEVLTLRRESWEEGDAEDRLDAADARLEAADFLRQQGFDPAQFEDDPEIQRDEVGSQTGMVLRYQRNEMVFGRSYPYGVEVYFDRGQASGFSFWFDDPHIDDLQSTFRDIQLVNFGRVAFFYFLLPLVAVPFLKRYHDGQLGVRRGLQFFTVSLGAAFVFVVLNSHIFSAGSNLGFLSRQQTTWMVGGFSLIFQFLGLAVLALMSWSVGESLCRERWPQKLAAIDALFRLKWSNTTVALSMLRGLAGGTLMAGVLFALSTLGQGLGAWPLTSLIYNGNGFDSALPVVSFLTGVVCYYVPIYLFVCLLVPCWATARFGSTLGLILALATAAVIAPVLIVLPLGWGWILWAVVAGIPVLLFRFGDLLSGLMAGLTAVLLITKVVPALHVADATIQ
ncbi:MAG: hypothetical protein AAF657_32010, partial [Acidobacteriota bacterium]